MSVRRFRLDLECSHRWYLTTIGAPLADPPQHSPLIICTTCATGRAVIATTEVPAIEPRLDCVVCHAEAPADEVVDAASDHPRVTYVCPNGHERTVQL
jgi:hypothetical protein